MKLDALMQAINRADFELLALQMTIPAGSNSKRLVNQCLATALDRSEHRSDQAASRPEPAKSGAPVIETFLT